MLPLNTQKTGASTWDSAIVQIEKRKCKSMKKLGDKRMSDSEGPRGWGSVKWENYVR